MVNLIKHRGQEVTHMSQDTVKSTDLTVTHKYETKIYSNNKKQ